MVRSVWKGPFVEASLLKKADAARASGRHDVIKIWSRRSTILPQFVGLTFGVYNGQKHVPVSINEEMVGHKFGEFSPTRTHAVLGVDRGALDQRQQVALHALAAHVAAATELAAVGDLVDLVDEDDAVLLDGFERFRLHLLGVEQLVALLVDQHAVGIGQDRKSVV